jgi:hypothetical protein
MQGLGGTHTHLGGSAEEVAARHRAIDLNNLGLTLQHSGDLCGAQRALEEAVKIKVQLFGEVNVNVCISLSGLADVLLARGKAGEVAALEQGEAAAQRLRRIARQIRDPQQERIAHEILVDLANARVAVGLPRGAPLEPPPVTPAGKTSHSYATPAPSGLGFSSGVTSSGCASTSCLSHASKHCGACRTVGYCSQKCQKDHWPLHKAACRDIVAAKAAKVA